MTFYFEIVLKIFFFFRGGCHFILYVVLNLKQDTITNSSAGGPVAYNII